MNDDIIDYKFLHYSKLFTDLNAKKQFWRAYLKNLR